MYMYVTEHANQKHLPYNNKSTYGTNHPQVKRNTRVPSRV